MAKSVPLPRATMNASICWTMCALSAVWLPMESNCAVIRTGISSVAGRGTESSRATKVNAGNSTNTRPGGISSS